MKNIGLDAVDEARVAGLQVDGIFEADLFADDYLPVVDSVLGEAERGKKVIITTLSNAYMYIIIISAYTGCLRHSIYKILNIANHYQVSN